MDLRIAVMRGDILNFEYSNFLREFGLREQEDFEQQVAVARKRGWPFEEPRDLPRHQAGVVIDCLTLPHRSCNLPSNIILRPGPRTFDVECEMGVSETPPIWHRRL